MKDFLLFRRMLMPLLIQILFWGAVIACIITGIVNLSRGETWNGIEVLVFGPIVARVACEFFILFFRINETLTDIKNTVQGQK